MREFRDNEGRPWRLALTCASAARVKDMVTYVVTDDVEQPDGTVRRETRRVPFDLIDTANIARTLEVLRGQFSTIGDVLYAMLLKQVEERKLTKDEFLDGLQGDSIEAASKAIEMELVDFFPLRLRRMVGLLVTKLDELANEVIGKAEAGLEAATAESLLAQSGMASGKPPESLASTQESGPTANSPQPATAG